MPFYVKGPPTITLWIRTGTRKEFAFRQERRVWRDPERNIENWLELGITTSILRQGGDGI